jgi:hypothetical protein
LGRGKAGRPRRVAWPHRLKPEGVAVIKIKKKTKKKTASAAKTRRPVRKKVKRTKWLDPRTKTPLIDDYARKMSSFLKAMADGVIDEKEVKAQETRLVGLMKKVEPQLDDELHAQVTQLLCQLTVYDLMQTMSALHRNRPVHTFHG